MKIQKMKGTKAHQRYRLQDGTIVPGCTTIVGQLDKSGALMYWAWSLGMKGEDYKKYRDKTADIGTLAHCMVQESLGGTPVDRTMYSPDMIDLAENALISFYEWEKGHVLETSLIEAQLVSEKFRFGGAIDWYGTLDGKLTLLDFKTSKAIYDSHKLQLAGYWHLLRENGYQVDGVQILRIGRDESEGFDNFIIPEKDLSVYWEMFERLCDVYYLKRQVGYK